MSSSNPNLLNQDGPSNAPSGGSSYNVNSKIMIVAIVVLFGVVFFILGLHIYAKWFWRNGGGLLHAGGGSGVSWRRRRRLEFAVASQTRAGQVGLDDAVKESLPTFVFNAEKATADGMECAVCLEEFGEGENGRLLPKCNHAFHIDCIDMWFQSNSTCPLCRCSVVPDPPPAPEPSPSEPIALPREAPHSLATYHVPDGNYYFSEDLPPHSVLNYRDDPEAVQAVVDSMLVHRIPEPSAPSVPAEELSSSQRRSSSVDVAPKAAPVVQYPSNVLFWGNQSQVNVGYGAAREENITRQISAAGIHAPNCLVIEIPRVAAIAQVAAGDEPSRLSDAGGSKSPIGRLVTTSFRRLMSIRRGAAVSPGPEANAACANNDCEQGAVAVSSPGTAQRQS